jgi:hypothetical protein
MSMVTGSRSGRIGCRLGIRAERMRGTHLYSLVACLVGLHEATVEMSGTEARECCSWHVSDEES